MRGDAIIGPSFFSLLAMSLLSCTTPHVPAETVTWGPVRTYSGSYTPGWEFSDFTPVSSKETWWLSGNLERFSPLKEGYHPHGVHLFVTVEAQLSSPGQYGHLGHFPRELRVTRVISVRRLHNASNKSLQPTALWRCASMPILISLSSVGARPRSQSGG